MQRHITHGTARVKSSTTMELIELTKCSVSVEFGSKANSKIYRHCASPDEVMVSSDGHFSFASNSPIFAALDRVQLEYTTTEGVIEKLSGTVGKIAPRTNMAPLVCVYAEYAEDNYKMRFDPNENANIHRWKKIAHS